MSGTVLFDSLKAIRHHYIFTTNKEVLATKIPSSDSLGDMGRDIQPPT